MKMLEDRIRKDGIVREGNVLKVDSFINHQMDIPLFREMAKEWKRLFAGKPINKVLTIEASGIAAAITTAQVSTIHSAMSCWLPLPGCRNSSQEGRLSSTPAASAPNKVRAMMPMVFCASLWPCA